MLLNGEPYACRDGLTLHTILAELELRQEAIVVMHGDKIYRRGQIPDVPVQPSDVIEIVKMTQGG